MGPLLYILYTNEIVDVIDNDVVLFADDTSCLCRDRSLEGCERQVGCALDTLERFFSANNLKLNVEKTQILIYGNRREHTLSFSYRNTQLMSVDAISFLGIKIDRRIDWKAHIEDLAGNMGRYCHALRVVVESVGGQAALTAYHAYVQSRIRYGIIFWAGSTDSGRILRLQKKCVRILCQLGFRDSCRRYFVEKNIQTIFNIYIYECVAFILDNHSLFADMVGKHDHDTRYKSNLITGKINYTYIQRNVTFSIMKVWNKLPLTLRAQHPRVIKKRLRAFLGQRAYYGLDGFFSDDLKDLT